MSTKTSEEAQSTAGTPASGVQTYNGNCHCGAVRFECDVDLAEGGSRCNCSICTRTAVLGGMVKPAAFRLLLGEAALASYEWGGKISRRFFCKQCGVHCFGRGHLPELGGDYVSINFNCLEGIDVGTLAVRYWDGRHNNWDAGPSDRPWPSL